MNIDLRIPRAHNKVPGFCFHSVYFLLLVNHNPVPACLFSRAALKFVVGFGAANQDSTVRIFSCIFKDLNCWVKLSVLVCIPCVVPNIATDNVLVRDQHSQNDDIPDLDSRVIHGHCQR
jgi:hypothetical protein